MMAATNPTPVHHDVTQIVFSLPIGSGNGDLTSNPAVQTTPALGVPWTIDSDGAGGLTAMPQPPATGLGPADSIAFFVSAIQVNELPGLAEITVYEQADAVRQALLAVSKVPPGLAITEFTASPIQVPPGQPTTLAWQTTGADSVTLSWQGGSKLLAPNGQCVMRPSQSTLYTLTATGSGHSTYQQLTVYVPEVRIISFGASPAQVAMNGPSALSWRVVNAEAAYIEPGHHVVDPDSGRLVVATAATTTYVLSATGFGDTRSMPAIVNVMPVEVGAFTATPGQVPPGATLPATLAWSSQWATAVEITPSVGPVPASGQATVTPAQTTTYALAARGLDPVTRTATVTVAPAIVRFSLLAPTPDQISVLWKVIGGTVTLAIDGGDPMTYPASASLPLTAPFPSTLTMTVTGGGLSTAFDVSLPGDLGGAQLDELTAACDYGINATGATGKLTWQSTGTTVSGEIVAATTIPLSGRQGCVAVPYPTAGAGAAWSLDFRFGPSAGQKVSWQVHARTAGRHQVLTATGGHSLSGGDHMTQVAATTTWVDFAVRPNTTSPEGQVPVTGPIVVCPDIIPQTTAVHDPQSVFSTPASWAESYPAQVQQGAANYIYVRARNFDTGPETGTIRLYAVGDSLIQWPSQWINSPLEVQTGGSTVPISAQTSQEIVVGAQPFYWQAPPPPAGSDHYCLFSLVDTPKTPNPLLHSNVPDNYNTMVDLVTNSLNVGWKNIAEVPTNVPTWTSQMTLNIPPTAEANQQLHIYAFGTSGTVGGQVAVSSGDSQGFDPVVNIAQTTIQSSSETYGLITTPSPGLAKTVLNVSFWTSNSNPGFKDRIVVVAGWVPPSIESIGYLIAAGAARRLPLALAADTIGWEVPIGAMSYRFSAV
jgi:hypothetical protein